MFRQCGDCSECCTGKLDGNAYGNSFNIEKPCVFLVEKKCCIYKTRPDTCARYQCAWSQGILPESMRPDICGYIVSVEIKNNKQFLKIVSHNKLDKSTSQFFDAWCKENNTYYEVTNGI